MAKSLLGSRREMKRSEMMKHPWLFSIIATILAFASGLRAAKHPDVLKEIAEIVAKHKVNIF